MPCGDARVMPYGNGDARTMLCGDARVMPYGNGDARTMPCGDAQVMPCRFAVDVSLAFGCSDMEKQRVWG